MAQAEWESFDDVKAVFGKRADQYKQFVIFDIGGNKSRLIAAIHYNTGRVFIRHRADPRRIRSRQVEEGLNMATPTARSTPLTKLYGRHHERYLELLARFPLRPVRTEAELDAATEVIHELIDQDKRSAAEDDYLDVLSDLV